MSQDCHHLALLCLQIMPLCEISRRVQQGATHAPPRKRGMEKTVLLGVMTGAAAPSSSPGVVAQPGV